MGSTIARRLSRLESSLPPKAAVLLWLDEAHAFPTASAYVSCLLTQPRGAYPLVGIPELVERAAREAVRGSGGAEAERTVRDAVSDAVILVHLVLGVVTVVEETLHTEGLRAAALTWYECDRMHRSPRHRTCPSGRRTGESTSDHAGASRGIRF